MHPYLPNTNEDIKEMLDVIGLGSTDELFDSIPKNLKFNRDLNLPSSKSEIEVKNILEGIASKNQSTSDLTCFLGAGSMTTIFHLW